MQLNFIEYFICEGAATPRPRPIGLANIQIREWRAKVGVGLFVQVSRYQDILQRNVVGQHMVIGHPRRSRVLM